MIHKIYRDDEVIVAVDGYPYTVSVDSPVYDDVCIAIENDDEEELRMLLSTKGKSVKLYAQLAEHGIEESDGEFTYKGNPIAMDLNDYLLASLDSGQARPIIRFIERLFENPSHDTRSRLFTFMEHNRMPLDEDGRFLAFKGVRADYRDKHTGTIDNSPGVTVPRMSWSEVDTDPTNHCSRGYHACSKDYLNDFWYNASDRVVSVAIGPEDVGSIPLDYDGAKLRCRQYTVVADVTDAYTKDTANVTLRSKINPNWDDDYSEQCCSADRW